MQGKWDAKAHWVSLAALTCGLLLGCSKHSPPTSPTATGARPIVHSSSNESGPDDPCSLLEPKEVEAVLGAPLAVPPYRSDNSCMYEAANFRIISLEVYFSGGAQVYSMVNMTKTLLKSSRNAEIANNVKKNFKLDDGTEMSGEWDEASLVAMTCCTFAALRGDQLITIDFTASPATLRQAATLVDAAYKRIDHPLKIDGTAGVTAAKALEKTRPKQVDACSMLTRSELEGIVGTLTANPSAEGDSVCNIRVLGQNNVPALYEIHVFWHGGYSQWRSDRHVAGIGIGALNQMAADVNNGHLVPGMPTAADADAKAAAAETKPAIGGDPAEAIDETPLGFTMVKRDVLVRVKGYFVDAAKVKALVAALAQKI
jgi:hypothetical protein